MKKLSTTHLVMMIIWVCSASVASIFLKLGGDAFGFTLNPIDFITKNYWLVLGYGIYVLVSLATLYFYKFYKVGYVQAIAAASYVINPVLAYFILSERFNILKILGILIIFSAIIMLALSAEENNKDQEIPEIKV